MSKVFLVIGYGVVILVLSGAITAGIAWVLEFVWNSGVAPAFHGPVLTYWEVLCIVVFFSVIGSFFRSSAKKD